MNLNPALQTTILEMTKQFYKRFFKCDLKCIFFSSRLLLRTLANVLTWLLQQMTADFNDLPRTSYGCLIHLTTLVIQEMEKERASAVLGLFSTNDSMCVYVWRVCGAGEGEMAQGCEYSVSSLQYLDLTSWAH